MTLAASFISSSGHSLSATYWHTSDGSTETVEVIVYGRSNDAPEGWRAETASILVPVLTGPDPTDGDRLTIGDDDWTVGRPSGDTGPTVRSLGCGQAWSLYVSRARRMKK